jgi:hypothetical protein
MQDSTEALNLLLSRDLVYRSFLFQRDRGVLFLVRKDGVQVFVTLDVRVDWSVDSGGPFFNETADVLRLTVLQRAIGS